MDAAVTHHPAVDANAARMVRALMGYHGLTQEEVAAAVGMSSDTLGRRLSRDGKTGRDFKASEIGALAWFFGTGVVEFYNGTVELQNSTLRPKDPSGIHCSGVNSSWFEMGQEAA